jgi:SSS family solute:Na+ symporter
MAALVIAAGLAALMSTMDSQLLTLSSIFTRDIFPLVRKAKMKTSVAGRVFVILLSLTGLALAYKPPATILQIATQTFTGLAVLFPTIIFGLYFKRVFALAAILSIGCGETALIGFFLNWLPNYFFLPIIWIMLITFTVYLITHGVLLWKENLLQLRMPEWLFDRYVWLLSAIFLLAMDFWAWGRIEPIIFGVPLWVGYFVVLSALQTIVMVYLIRKEDRVKNCSI